MKYGLKLTSTMIYTTSYILLDSKDEVKKAFQMFQEYIRDKYEDSNEKWINYCNECEHIYCDDDDDFMVGKLENGNFILLTPNKVDWNKPCDTYEFELVIDYTERF